MFDKFGEFDSVEELNEAAAGQLAQGDTEAIYLLAAENGIAKLDAEDYIDGMVPELASAMMAAFGKLEVEAQELKVKDIMADWTDYIKQCCIKEEMARAVRKKGKSLKGCIAELLKWSFSNQRDIDADILKACNIKAGKVTLGIPGMGIAKKIITEYYLGK